MHGPVVALLAGVAMLGQQASPARPSLLDVKARASAEVVAPGERFQLVLDLAPSAGIHVYAPEVRNYRPIAIRVDASPGLSVVGAPRYPVAELCILRTAEGDGPRVSEAVPRGADRVGRSVVCAGIDGDDRRGAHVSGLRRSALLSTAHRPPRMEGAYEGDTVNRRRIVFALGVITCLAGSGADRGAAQAPTAPAQEPPVETYQQQMAREQREHPTLAIGAAARDFALKGVDGRTTTGSPISRTARSLRSYSSPIIAPRPSCTKRGSSRSLPTTPARA